MTQAHRRVWRLRIFQDQRYPLLISACAEAMRCVSGNPAGLAHKVGCIEIYGNWKHWLCVFPQHGRGPKHERSIVLAPWQRRIVTAHPRSLLRGLVHSDGCRSMNRVHRRTLGGVKEYAYPRYFFSNASPDIRVLFAEACTRIGVACRPTTERVLSVAQRGSVWILDEFIGPKR